MSPHRHRYEIVRDAEIPADDESVVSLLTRVYVDAGFTEKSAARDAFAPSAVRARGSLYWFRDEDGALGGMVVLVPPSSPARRFAGPHDAELHLLAVDPALRGRGLGTALVNTVIDEARRDGYRELFLWTQPTMHAAHHVYTKAGFVPSNDRDFERGGRKFRVMRRGLNNEP